MKKIMIYTVDAFTNIMFEGNPAGVVINAEGLNTAEMQSIAKEVNLSETAFLYKECDDYYRIRYFTPTNEIDFCGHATIATGWVLEKVNNIDINYVKLKTNIGVVELSSIKENQELLQVLMHQVPPKLKDYNESLTEILNCLNLTIDMVDCKYPVKYAYTGNWHLLIPIINKTIIDNTKPDYSKLKEHNLNRGISTTHLFTFDSNGKDILLYTRDFAPAVGVNEDPVTGSANGALAGYLVLEKAIPKNSEFFILQTNSLKRYGNLFIRTSKDDDNIKIQVGGAAVIVIKGEIILA